MPFIFFLIRGGEKEIGPSAEKRRKEEDASLALRAAGGGGEKGKHPKKEKGRRFCSSYLTARENRGEKRKEKKKRGKRGCRLSRREGRASASWVEPGEKKRGERVVGVRRPENRRRKNRPSYPWATGGEKRMDSTAKKKRKNRRPLFTGFCTRKGKKEQEKRAALAREKRKKKNRSAYLSVSRVPGGGRKRSRPVPKGRGEQEFALWEKGKVGHSSKKGLLLSRLRRKEGKGGGGKEGVCLV